MKQPVVRSPMMSYRVDIKRLHGPLRGGARRGPASTRSTLIQFASGQIQGARSVSPGRIGIVPLDIGVIVCLSLRGRRDAARGRWTVYVIDVDQLFKFGRCFFSGPRASCHRRAFLATWCCFHIELWYHDEFGAAVMRLSCRAV